MSNDGTERSKQDDSPFLNKSMKSAYADILMEHMSRSPNVSRGSSIKDNAMVLDDSSQSSYGSEEDEDEEDQDYQIFKTSLYKGDTRESLSAIPDYYDSQDDSDYTEEADKSFIVQNEESEFDSDYITHSDYNASFEDDTPEDNLWESTYRSSKVDSTGFLRRLCIASTLLILVAFYIISQLNRNSDTPLTYSKLNSADISYTGLQKQIDHLHRELNLKDRINKDEFEKTVRAVISQFEKNIKEMIPSNIMDVKLELDSLVQRVNDLSRRPKEDTRHTNTISLANISEWQARLKRELETTLPAKIPIVVNNSSTFMILPEMHKYLYDLIDNMIKHSNTFEIELSSQDWKYDVNNYVKEILIDDLKFVEKSHFINELDRRLRVTKEEIMHEVASKIKALDAGEFKSSNSQTMPPEQYSSILLKKLVNKIYNANQHQWENDLDFATYVQGTKLIKHLTSATFSKGNGVSPIELLADTKLSSSSTYWQCKPGNGCTWAIRFIKSIYLTKLSYMHGRLANNLHIMNSAPKLISIFVKLSDLDKNKENEMVEAIKAHHKEPHYKDGHIKITQFTYQLTDNSIKQVIPLPGWFIHLRVLVKSMIFVIDQNYGNEDYTSLRKFVVNGVTLEDLKIMETNKTPLMLADVPNYGSNPTDGQRAGSLVNKQNDAEDTQDVPPFGQDEVDIRQIL